MLLIAVAMLSIVSVPLSGGKLTRLGWLKLRWSGLLVAALALQVLIISLLPSGGRSWHVAAHLGSYGLCGAWFVVNRKTPGLWIIAVGAALNAVAIGVNGGIMPASPSAMATAGIRPVAGEFANSAVTAHPRFLIFGDIFALPRAWPLHNVFSIGDLLIGVGIFLAVNRICRQGLLDSPSRSLDVVE